MASNKQIQTRLKELGFYHDTIDGIFGPNTNKAIVSFKRSVGLRGRPYIGEITLRALFGDQAKKKRVSVSEPWINELYKYEGMHESKRELADWLKSDGGTVGNPDDFPWCGDAMHTAIRNTLPDERFPGNVGKNPYLAMNWTEFGDELSEPCYGCQVSLWRKSPDSIYGHIACIVGYDPKLERYKILGGNQSNTINETWIAADRVRKHGFRFPRTYDGKRRPVPIMNAAGKILSTNEA